MDEQQFNTYYNNMMNSLFNQWKKEVNRIVYNELGINCEDLKDEDYRLYFGRMEPPREVATRIIRNNNHIFPQS